MRIEFTYSRTRKYFRAQLARGASEATKWPRTVAQLLIAGGVVVPFVLPARGKVGQSVSQVGLQFGVALLTVGVLLLVATLGKRHRMVTVDDSWLVERTWNLTDDSYESWTGQSLIRHSWAQLRLLRIYPMAYVLISNDGVVTDVPREPLTKKDDAELRAFLGRLPRRDAPPVTIEPITGERTHIEFVSEQSVRPVGARLIRLHRRQLRRQAAPIVLGGLAVIAAGVAVGVALHQPFPILLGVLITVPLLFVLARLWFAPLPRDPAGAPRVYTITEDTIQTDGESWALRWDRSLVQRVEEWPETYLLHQRGGKPFAIPRDTLTDEQDAELRALLLEGIESADRVRAHQG